MPSVWAMTTADPARLLRVRAADNGAVLYFTVEYVGDDGPTHEELCVFSARLDRVPGVGAIDASTLELLLREDAMYRAMRTGMQALSAADCSAQRLVYKLFTKGFARELAQSAVRELARAGYLDERRGALREAERGVTKLWGDRRILGDLRAKGYGTEALSAACDYLAGENAEERCRRLVKKRRIVLPEDRYGREKVIAALLRYGYTPGTVRAVLCVDVEE